MSAYPIVLDGRSVSALIVGGGSVATRKVRSLLEASARVHVVAPHVCPELAELAVSSANASIRITHARYTADQIAGATLVIAATNDSTVNAAVAEDAKRAGVLVNVIDASDLGDFVTPAVHRSRGVVVAVVAGGVPGAAARIRDVIAESIDQRYGQAVDALAGLRRELLDRGDRDAWRKASAALIGTTFREDVESGRLAARVETWR